MSIPSWYSDTLDEAALYVDGNRNTIDANAALDTDGDAFFVEGDGSELTACIADGAGNDGFDINEGTGNSLDRCIAHDCDGEALDNAATGTNVTNCRFTDSRVLVANEGTFGTFSGNNVALDDVAPQQTDD